MKVLTIKNPWAELIVKGYKEYEFRSWKTNYRGKILIHAGLNIEKDSLNKFKEYNLSYINGAIIGEAYITDCIKVDKVFDKNLRKIDNVVYGSNHESLYAWKLEKVKKYNNPIFIKGKLGLWNYEKK